MCLFVSIQGHFINGSKEGRGCFYFSDGSTLSGSFKQDALEGEGVYTYSDGSQMTAWYREGVLDGKFTEVDANGVVTAEGHHVQDKRNGFIQLFEEDGSMLMGVVDNDGCLSGDDIVYVYPDKRTAIIGLFNNAVLVKGRYAWLTTLLDVPASSLPKLELNEDIAESVVFDRSNHDHLSSQPVLQDAYEQERVHVRLSLIPNGGEGLFAQRCLSEGEIVSFYNGIRLSHVEVDGRDWSENSNTISLDDETVLDIPLKYSSVDKYCATLGHKANHSQTPNCEYLPFLHPRYGDIKCIATLRDIKAGEELTCDYGYTHKSVTTGLDDLPDWYMKGRENQRKM